MVERRSMTVERGLIWSLEVAQQQVTSKHHVPCEKHGPLRGWYSTPHNISHVLYAPPCRSHCLEAASRLYHHGYHHLAEDIKGIRSRYPPTTTICHPPASGDPDSWYHATSCSALAMRASERFVAAVHTARWVFIHRENILS